MYPFEFAVGSGTLGNESTVTAIASSTPVTSLVMFFSFYFLV